MKLKFIVGFLTIEHIRTLLRILPKKKEEEEASNTNEQR